MYKRVKIKKGDTVKVIAGGNKGKTGTVMQVLRKEDRVLVESVNVVTKHVKPSPANPQGGIEKREAPIHISNVMVMDGNGTPPVSAVAEAMMANWSATARNLIKR